jgi:CheY-like chemotaxis protein
VLQVRFPSLFVLVVEADLADSLLTREALETGWMPAQVSVVADGIEAMAQLRREGIHAATEHPDPVLLDLNLPRIDRWAVC